MAYRLDPRHPVARQLADLARRELEGALASLAAAVPDAEAVHDARRRVKRVRALLCLVEGPLGQQGVRLERRLRNASRALAAMREADANLECLAALRKHQGTVLTAGTARRVERGLEGRERESRVDPADALARARRGLERSRATVPRALRTVARFRAIRTGAHEAYRATRRVLRGLDLDAGDADFHRWRRRLKDHYYHVLLLERVDPAARRRARALHRLEETLGDDHNLTVLATLLLTDPRRYGTPRDTALVLGCITGEQRRLRLRALAQGRRDFRWSPREFATRFERWWRSA